MKFYNLDWVVMLIDRIFFCVKPLIEWHDSSYFIEAVITKVNNLFWSQTIFIFFIKRWLEKCDIGLRFLVALVKWVSILAIFLFPVDLIRHSNLLFSTWVKVNKYYLLGGGGGQQSTMISILASRPSCLWFNSQHSQNFQRIYFDIAEVNHRCWLEERGQLLENVNWTHLVLASGKPLLQKIICFVTFSI